MFIDKYFCSNDSSYFWLNFFKFDIIDIYRLIVQVEYVTFKEGAVPKLNCDVVRRLFKVGPEYICFWRRRKSCNFSQCTALQGHHLQLEFGNPPLGKIPIHCLLPCMIIDRPTTFQCTPLQRGGGVHHKAFENFRFFILIFRAILSSSNFASMFGLFWQNLNA